jgi:hypothetical protein
MTRASPHSTTQTHRRRSSHEATLAPVEVVSVRLCIENISIEEKTEVQLKSSSLLTYQYKIKRKRPSLGGGPGGKQNPPPGYSSLTI